VLPVFVKKTASSDVIAQIRLAEEKYKDDKECGIMSLRKSEAKH